MHSGETRGLADHAENEVSVYQKLCGCRNIAVIIISNYYMNCGLISRLFWFLVVEILVSVGNQVVVGVCLAIFEHRWSS